MTHHGSNEHPELVVQPFDANTELNDYEVSPLIHLVQFPVVVHLVYRAPH
jgi:hypothetical protein